MFDGFVDVAASGALNLEKLSVKFQMSSWCLVNKHFFTIYNKLRYIIYGGYFDTILVFFSHEKNK